MKEKTDHLIIEICNKQDYDSILRQIIKQNKESNVENLLEEINSDKDIPIKQKQKIYETIFDYINYANDEIAKKVKDIFKMGVKEAIKSYNNKN